VFPGDQLLRRTVATSLCRGVPQTKAQELHTFSQNVPSQRQLPSAWILLIKPTPSTKLFPEFSRFRKILENFSQKTSEENDERKKRMKKIPKFIYRALPAAALAVGALMANGAPGDLIVPASPHGSIVRVPLNPLGAASFVWDNSNLPPHSWRGIAFDQAGNLYASDDSDGQPGTGKIYKLPPDRTILSLFATGLSSPGGLAVDAAGNLYEADIGSGTVNKFTSEGVRTTFFSGCISGSTIVFDSQGNLFVPTCAVFTDPPGCEECAHYIGIYKIDPQGAWTVPYFLPGYCSAAGIGFDSGGNLWVVSHNGYGGANYIFEYPQPGRDNPVCYDYFGIPSNGLAIDVSNNKYVGGPGTGIRVPCTLDYYNIIGLGDLLWGEGLGQLVIEPPAYAAQVQPPINGDGTSIFNSRRGVVSVRFTLTYGGVATCTLPPATIAVTRTAGGVTGQVNESVYTASADTGSNFRTNGCQYMYNLDSHTLGVGIYRVDIKMFGGAVGSATFELR
jgi:hypothetical protein